MRAGVQANFFNDGPFIFEASFLPLGFPLLRGVCIMEQLVLPLWWWEFFSFLFILICREIAASQQSRGRNRVYIEGREASVPKRRGYMDR